MNYKLIMLDNPILVSDEEIKEGDEFIAPHNIEVEMEWLSNDNEEHCVYFEKQSKITHNTIKVTKVL